MSETTVDSAPPIVNPDGSRTEEWRPVAGYEGMYEVSSAGRVKSLARTKRNRWAGFVAVPEKILAPDCATGYERVSLHRSGRLDRQLVHRLVARAFLSVHPRQHVNHKDGNKRNNRVENLEWATPRENVRHAWATGLSKARQGEDATKAKLTDRDVSLIMGAVVRGVPQRTIAQVFDVTEAAISALARGKSWKVVHDQMKETA